MRLRTLFSPIASLFPNLVWAFAAQVLNLIAMVITLKVWAVYLAPADLGLMGLIIGAGSILVGVVISPLLQSIFVSYASHASKGHAHELRTITGRMVAGRTVVVILLILIAGVPLSSIFNLHWSMPLVIAGLFAVDAWRSFEEILFAAACRQREVAIISVADVWFRLAFVWGGLHILGAGAYTAIASNLVGATIFVVLMRLFLPLEAHPGAKLIADSQRRSTREEISQLARPLMPSVVLASLTEMANRYIIGGTIGLQAAGLFVVTYGLVKRPYGMLNYVTSMTITPVLSKAIAAQDKTAIRTTQRLWVTVAVSGAGIGAVLFYALRDLIVTVLLSKQYSAAGNLLFGLAIAIAIYNVANVFNWFLTAVGNTRSVLFNNAIGCAATLLLTSVLCPLMGIPGAVWALLTGYLLQLFVSLWIFQVSKIHKELDQKKSLPSVTCSTGGKQDVINQAGVDHHPQSKASGMGAIG